MNDIVLKQRVTLKATGPVSAIFKLPIVGRAGGTDVPGGPVRLS